MVALKGNYHFHDASTDIGGKLMTKIVCTTVRLVLYAVD
jgi:hypothetical protein